MKIALKIIKISLITFIIIILSILLMVGGTLFTIWNFIGNDKTYDTDSFYRGDTTFLNVDNAGSHWSLGFSKSIITPEDALTNSQNYYLAGYNNEVNPREIFDDIWVRAIYLDDNTGRGGVLFAVIDCIGLSNKEILMIRAGMKDFAAENNIKSINVMSTHNHAGVDTQGLWGSPFKLKSGINPEYNQFLRDKTADTMIEAFNNRENGKLYWGDVTTEDLIHDNRIPHVYDDTVTRIRFVPEDINKAPLFIVSMGCHPEMMARDNYAISADFPTYMGRYIKEHTCTNPLCDDDCEHQSGSDFIFFNGAVGVLINGQGLDDVFDGVKDNKEFTVEFGEKVGKYVSEIEDTEEILPVLNIRMSSILIPVENTFLIFGAKVNLINTSCIKNPDKNGPKYVVPSEVGYMELGNSIRIAMAPGELAPEWALGGFLPASESANGYDMDVTPIFETMGAGKNLIFGLCNDQIGYIIPDNDFLLHKYLPYINWANDSTGRQHYEETVSTGRNTGRQLLKEWEKIISEVRD